MCPGNCSRRSVPSDQVRLRDRIRIPETLASLVTHSTAICDSIAAIPPYSALQRRGSIDLRYPSLPPPPQHNFAILLKWRGITRDTLRYLENVDAMGIALPYSAIGGVPQCWITKLARNSAVVGGCGLRKEEGGRAQAVLCERAFVKTWRGKGSRLVGETRLVVFPRPSRSQFEKATSRDPLSSRDPLPFAPFQKVQEGGGCRPEGGGSRLEGASGSRLVVFFGLYGVEKRGNTTSRVPPTSPDPSHFPNSCKLEGGLLVYQNLRNYCQYRTESQRFHQISCHHWILKLHPLLNYSRTNFEHHNLHFFQSYTLDIPQTYLQECKFFPTGSVSVLFSPLLCQSDLGNWNLHLGHFGESIVFKDSVLHLHLDSQMYWIRNVTWKIPTVLLVAKFVLGYFVGALPVLIRTSRTHKKRFPCFGNRQGMKGSLPAVALDGQNHAIVIELSLASIIAVSRSPHRTQSFHRKVGARHKEHLELENWDRASFWQKEDL